MGAVELKGGPPKLGGPTLKTALETLYIGGEEGGKGEGDPASSGITCLRCTNTVPHLSLWGEGAVLSRLRCLRRRLCTSRPSAEARLARLATKLEPLVPLPRGPTKTKSLAVPGSEIVGVRCAGCPPVWLPLHTLCAKGKLVRSRGV